MDLSDRTVLITGANIGIGRATALALAERGARLFLAGRSAERHDEVIAAVRAVGSEASYLPLELGDLSSVRACASGFLERDVPLHLLINNAGLGGVRGQTVDGFEIMFGVNHLGHFLLTELLLDRLVRSAPGRIVYVASHAHYGARGINWTTLREPTKTMTGMKEYRVSKLCNVLHAKELALRLSGAGVTTYALHPGVVATNNAREVPWGLRQLIGATLRTFAKTPEQGAQTSIYCATSEQTAGQTGLYYEDCQPRAPNELANDVALASELRRRSAQWTALTGPAASQDAL